MLRRRAKSAASRLVVACTVALVALAPLRARAEERSSPLELTWSAPAGCATRDEVIAHVDALVGRDLPPGHRTIAARGRIVASSSPDEARYRLELIVVGDEANRRSMEGDDCTHLVDAAALILALDIDPDGLARRAGFEAQAPPPAAAAHARTGDAGAAAPGSPSPPRLDASRTRALPLPAPAPPRSRPLDFYGGARLTLDEGSLPRTTVGIGASFGLVRGPIVLEADANAFKDRFTVGGPRGGRGGAYIGLATFGARACWRGLSGIAEWHGCLGGELGALSTTGVSVYTPETARGLWSAASAMLSARLLPGRGVSPVAGLLFAHPLGAPDVFIEGFGTVFEPPLVVARCFLGLEVLFSRSP